MRKLRSPFAREVYERNANIYKLLANSKRLEILNTIRNQDANVSELSELLHMRKANVSQHLAVLRHLHMVKMRRDGQKVYYRIADPKIVEPCHIFKELHERKILK